MAYGFETFPYLCCRIGLNLSHLTYSLKVLSTILRPIVRLLCNFLILIPFISVLVFSACGVSGDRVDEMVSDSVEVLRREGMELLNRSEFIKAADVGRRLIKIAEETEGNSEAAIYGRLILGDAQIFNKNFREAYTSLAEAEKLCLEEKNDSALCIVYNGLGLYSINVEADLLSSLDFFFRGLDIAKQSENSKQHSILLSNIALTYYLLKEPKGLRYGQECYYYGKDTEQDYPVYTGAMVCAYFYNLENETALALKMIREAEILLHKNSYNDTSALYRLYGEILHNTGDLSQAEEYFKVAIDNANDQVDELMHSYLSYSSLLEDRGDNLRALELLDSAYLLSGHEGGALFRPDVLKSLVRIHTERGNTSKALEYSKIYNEEAANRDIEREKNLVTARIRHDAERTENAYMRQQIEILEKEKVNNLLIFALAILVCIAVCIFLLYRKKSRLYAAIVKQTGDAVRNEKMLRETIRSLENRLVDQSGETGWTDGSGEIADEPVPDGESGSGRYSSSLSGDKYRELIGRFESLMLDPEVYTSNDISKDKVARLLGTNRTYLSQIINEHYGMSFTQFINSLRIKEAIRRLSDPECDVPLKMLSAELGFNSMSTFYSQFNADTGMTPATYRSMASSK